MLGAVALAQPHTKQEHRIRDVRAGTDGFIYLLTDEANAVLARLEPVE